MNPSQLPLRYGCNPHQTPARVFVPDGELPFTVLNGNPGYINLLDALNSWQLVRELRAALSLPAAASFKHVSPAGAAVAVPMSDTVKKACCVDDMELSPLACAYARARGADRMSSFGDWAALSDTVDLSTAHLLKREVSDGVIAPGYDPEALAVLREKKGGRYTIIAMDPSWEPQGPEQRDLFGMVFEQQRATIAMTPEVLANVVTNNKDIPPRAGQDLILAQIALKYTQSNSVCFAHDGQITGTGAGQQSRIHCVRLAAEKSDRWFLRQHPRVQHLAFRPGLSRADMNNAIDQCFERSLTAAEEQQWESCFVDVPRRLSEQEKREWLNAIDGVSLASDAFFPFRDNIDRASQSGVRFIVQPGGATREEGVIAACNEYAMVMALTGIRLFTH